MDAAEIFIYLFLNLDKLIEKSELYSFGYKMVAACSFELQIKMCYHLHCCGCEMRSAPPLKTSSNI